MDFVGDSLASGRRIKCFTTADDFSHEYVDNRLLREQFPEGLLQFDVHGRQG